VFLHDTYTKYKSYECCRKFRHKFLTRPCQTRKRISYYVKGVGTGELLEKKKHTHTHTHETRTKEILDETGERPETSARNSMLPLAQETGVSNEQLEPWQEVAQR
jgi:hypothetical protein